MIPGTPDLRARWTLDPTVRFLNHGSFGATPRVVLDEQARLRAEMEAEPVEFLARALPARMEAVRARVASFLGADPAGLMPVSNATAGVNAVLRAFDWSAGDEILLADQTYNAVKQAARALADRHGVRVVEVTIPFPLFDQDEVVAAYAAGVTPRTRLVIVDHVVSPTALVLPVDRVVAVARGHGVPVLVDGAHGPGMLPLSLDALGADFYVGNLHKWVCAPKGAAVLHLGEAWRARVHPLAVSHGYGTGLAAEFDWTGTDDPTAWLCVPAALDFFAQWGWDDVRATQHALVRDARRLLADALDVSLPHPDDPAFYGAMAAVEWRGARMTSPNSLAALTGRLYREHRIEAPFTSYDGRIFLRVSGQLYNHPDEYAALADVLRTFQ